MILTVHIIRLEAGRYRGIVFEASEHLGEFDTSSIAEAIRLAGEQSHDEQCGFHLWYEHVCAGTVSGNDLRTSSHDLAERLARLHQTYRV